MCEAVKCKYKQMKCKKKKINISNCLHWYKRKKTAEEKSVEIKKELCVCVCVECVLTFSTRSALTVQSGYTSSVSFVMMMSPNTVTGLLSSGQY